MTRIKYQDATFEIPEVLPVLPLRDVVDFPHMVAPLMVGRPASIAAVQDAAAADRLLFVTAQHVPHVTEPRQQDLFPVGVVGRVVQVLPLPDGSRKVILEGMVRARLIQMVPGDDVQRGQVQVLQGSSARGTEIQALHRSVADLFAQYVELSQRVPEETLKAALAVQDPAQFVDTVAAHVASKVPVKQKILDHVDLTARLRSMSRILGEELEILHIERRIEGEIKSSVQKSQKEMYLHERLKAIRKELGHEESAGGDVEDLAEAIEAAGMSREARGVAYKEIERLSKMPALSPEAAVVRTYLEVLTSLPWKKTTRDRLDLAEVKAKLDADHYGLDKVKERILEYLAVMKLTRSLRGPILCLVGPPGVGKTSLGRSIAAALGRKFVRVSLGGIRDEAEIRGHRRTYIGAMPGRLLQSLRKCGSRNPVFVLDEIDKLGMDFRGDPASALLEALDPEQNAGFSDHYLEVGFDLSKVLFITTANVLYPIPPALRDRLEVIELPGYLDHEKAEIARHFLLPKQLREHGIGPADLELTDAAIQRIIHRYTREAGVRHLEREIGRLCRKVAREIAEAPASARRSRRGTLRVDRDDLERYLSVPPYTGKEVPEEPEVGVATALAWTSTGGEILPIEVTIMGGSGQLILTGQLGDVMKESARTALSYVRSISGGLGAKPGVFERKDIHVHVPEGAIPKDGPSAGLAIATALASLISGIPVDRRVGMTGEITLRGRALPIGGLNEKAVAALRAGVRTILIPQQNEKDIAELPASVKAAHEIVPVEGKAAVLQRVLRRTPSGARTRSRPPTRPQASNYTF